MMTSTFNWTERLHTVHAMHIIAYLRSHAPESTEPEKMTAKQSGSKSCGKFSVENNKI